MSLLPLAGRGGPDHTINSVLIRTPPADPKIKTTIFWYDLKRKRTFEYSAVFFEYIIWDKDLYTSKQ